MTAPEIARERKSLVSFSVAALLAMTAASAQVATGVTGIDATGSYPQEIQACMTGKTQQDRDTCLREARNAQADKKRGELDKANARSKPTPPRVATSSGRGQGRLPGPHEGLGNTCGSVAGGGLLREVETVVMPPGGTSVTIEPKTSDPVVLVPSPTQQPINK